MKKILNLFRYLPQNAYSLLLSLSASSYVIVIYLIKENLTLSFFPQNCTFISDIAYLLIPVAIAGVSLLLSRFLPVCSMECEIREVELASHSFLPNYLGYFFVALSIPDHTTLTFVYAVIFCLHISHKR